jgi:signal transduction histidine kinase
VSIKAKQVAGVTTLVVLIVAVLSAYHLATLTRLSLQETASRAELLSRAIFERARDVVSTAGGGADPYVALREDGGIRSILESSIGYSANVTYAAIVDPQGVAAAHSFPSLERSIMTKQEDFAPIVAAGSLAQLRAVYSDSTFEIRQPMLSGDSQFGEIRIGVSPLLVRGELQDALERAAQTVLVTLLVAMMVAMALAQWMLRPIHVIQSGLSRLGRGELDVRLDLREQEFRDLGMSFEAVSAQLATLGRHSAQTEDDPHTVRPGGGADFESVMENLEDAVALFSPAGDLMFSNAAMRALNFFSLPVQHPARQLLDRTLAGRKSQGPVSVSFRSDDRRYVTSDGRTPPDPRIPVAESRPPVAPEPRTAAGESPAHDLPELERLLMCHAIEDTNGRFLGAMLVARNLVYLSQVYSTLNYSHKLAALGRLMAGVAHEVKNPLNAMTIHLELLKQKLAAVREPITVAAGAGAGASAKTIDLTKHVNIIGSEIRRLDEVVGGFLKFARPDELKLQPVQLASLISEVVTMVGPEAERRGIIIKAECAADLPEINADPGMLSQALLNLAINGCQAMADGGTLRFACRPAARRRVEVDVEDTGVGIPPEHLSRIFDLYFTTKEKGSGIGLSMVYRIVQLHDGEVEVQSTPGHGTRFRLLFPQA